MKKLPLLILLIMFIVSIPVDSEARQMKDHDPLIERKIDSLLALMTLPEKVGQLVLFTSDIDVTGPTIREGYKEDIQKGLVGALFNAYGAKFTRELQKVAVEETRLGIPLLFGYDVIHGHRTIFPISLGEAASWDLEAIELGARIAAEEAAAEGLHWTYAPMVDISRDPRWGRVSEGAGEDPYLGSAIARARVKGFQGEDLKATHTILATVKHFAAYGASLAGRDYNTVDMSDRELRQTYLPPYKAALDAGAATVMTSFNEVHGIPASGSKYLMTDILRKEWGFDGFVVTDYTSINEMVPHGYSKDLKQAAEQAINAGVDMDMQGAAYYDHLESLVEEGKVSMSTIDQAVGNILRLKFKLGLFEDPYRYSDAEREKTKVMTKAHRQAARDVAKKSIVLLKNEDKVLPIKKDVKTIAVIGPLADSQRDLIGSWSAAGDHTLAVTVLQGITERAGSSVKILHAKGAEIEGLDTNGFEQALQIAGKADHIILALGEAYWMSGEAASRSDLDLPGVQRQLAEKVIALGKPTTTVLMSGRPLTIEWLDKLPGAILETWFLGTEAGNAIAEVLFGDYNPSGKLPMTFPRNVGQIPLFYATKNTGRPFLEHEKYTSKYLDVPNTPLYPFGYGLSYSNFTYSDLALDKEEYRMDETIQVTVKIKNDSDIGGEEVIQLYVRDLVGSVTRPVKELKGFQKVYFEAGEEKTITFQLNKDHLAFYTASRKFKTEPGDFEVYVGTNSSEHLSAPFTLLE